jgi:hypothetical protein
MAKPAEAAAQTTEHKKPEAPASKGKGNSPVPGGCISWGCKAPASQFNFCGDHYDYFKFGLVKKTGEPVSDYEKKFGHYVAYKAKQKAKKVA